MMRRVVDIAEYLEITGRTHQSKARLPHRSNVGEVLHAFERTGCDRYHLGASYQSGTNIAEFAQALRGKKKRA